MAKKIQNDNRTNEEMKVVKKKKKVFNKTGKWKP